MIALDTNLLVRARRADAPCHEVALAILERLAGGSEPWALPWPCIYEFVKVVTNPKIWNSPTSLEDALEDLDSLLACPTLVLLGEGPGHRGHLRRVLESGHATGNLAHDGHIAALCIEHGVSELWSGDGDFARFPALRWRDPFRKR